MPPVRLVSIVLPTYNEAGNIVALYNNGSMNLAENGLEQSVWAVNKTISDSTYNWSSNGWTISAITEYLSKTALSSLLRLEVKISRILKDLVRSSPRYHVSYLPLNRHR